MPVGDGFLADQPAQVDALAVAFGGEVHEPGLRVAQEDAVHGESLELGPKRRARVPVRTSAVGPAPVRDDLLLHDLRLPEDHLPGVADPCEALAELGQHRVGFVDLVQTLLGHHATPSSAGSWPIAVMRAPGASENRSRRSISTGNMPTARAGSTSNSGLSPT